jgi:hypothetical protein
MGDPTFSEVFGATTWITIGTALLLSSAAYIVMRLYVRAVLRESQRPAAGPTAASEIASLQSADGHRDSDSRAAQATELTIQTLRPVATGPRRSAAFRHADAAFRRAASVYALAGSIHAAASVSLLFLFGFYSLPPTPSPLALLVWRASVFWAWSVFTFVALALFWGPDRRFRLFLVGAYGAGLAAMGAILGAAGAPRLPLVDVALMPRNHRDMLAVSNAVAALVPGPPIEPSSLAFSPNTQPILFWALTGIPMLIPLLGFNRPIRATVGPLFFNLALAITMMTIVFLELAVETSPGVWLIAQLKHAAGSATFPILVTVALVVATALAWRGLLELAARYRGRQLSDQTFLFDALWLSVSLTVSAYLMGHPWPFVFLTGLMPFALYKVVVSYGLSGLKTGAHRHRNARLLFLRVFGSAARAERLFDLLAARWRYAGSVQLITSTDLARTQFEPDELLDFLSGRLGRSFINSESDLQQRLTGLATGPDADGRYRVNEFFCHEDTWQQTVTALMGDTDLVAMDLRGFAPTSKGCIFELGVILERVPLSRVVLLVDSTTDEPFLRATLIDLWARSTRRLIDAGRPAVIGILNLARRYQPAVQFLLALGDERLAAAERLRVAR